MICDPTVFSDLDPNQKTDCGHCVKLLHRVMPKLDAVVRTCLFQSSPVHCSEIFEDAITEEGMCHTFNGIDIYRPQTEHTEEDQTPEWTLDYGYKNTSTDGFEVYPRPGSKYGLNFFLQIHSRLVDNACKDPIQGFKVYVHMPNESPQVSKHYYIAPYEQDVQFFVDPRVIRSASEVRDFPVSKRQCYFSNERYLRFFKFYTQNNCDEECVANMTLSTCGCLRFHMPSKLFRARSKVND
jgi:acid-sensing ion channel, other